MPAGWILLLLLSFPVLEAISIFWMADAIGGWVLLWLIADVLAGVWLVKFERVAWSTRLLLAMRKGGNPLPGLFASGRMLLAGGLLVFPGFLSDAMALVLLLVPGTFAARAPRAANDDSAGVNPPGPSGAPPDTPTTIDGEFKRVSDERFPR